MTSVIKFSIFPHRKYRKRQWNANIKTFSCACVLLFVIVYAAISLVNYVFYSSLYSEDLLEDKGGIIDLTHNYFPSEQALLERGFLVDSEKCRIPKLDIWSNDVNQQPFNDNAEYNCSIGQPKITFVKENKVIINSSALAELGYDLKSVSCCYKTIHRIEESVTDYDKDADKRFRYSRKCVKMDKVTQPTSRYIKVNCHSRLLSAESYSYINFHALPLVHEEETDKTRQKYEESIKEKVIFWKECGKEEKKLEGMNERLCKAAKDSGTLPNVFIIGIDSTSRMNFQRFLKKTVRILEDIGAVEMQGFTKVGHNTLPNFIVSMTSHSLAETEKTCFTSNADPFDDCPFVWKNFSQQNYLTAHMEDCPELAIFNFLKTGFVEQPTDIYPRPLMLAMYKYLAREYTMKCMKYQRPEEMILNLAADLAVSAAETSLPFYISTWLTDLTHEHMNSLEMMDDVLSQTIDKLRQLQLLENTLLMVISDHGYRFLPIRRTLSGWYEDKLPALWMHVPESVQKAIVGSKENVVENSKSLISPYDIHATLKHLLAANLRTFEENQEAIGETFRVGKGISLFSKIPSRSCEETGIPPEYCACQVQIKYDHDYDIIRTVANAAVVRINQEFATATECHVLSLSYVFSSGIVRESFTRKGDIITAGAHAVVNSTDTLSPNDVLLIGFVTTPGQFFFESLVGFDPDTKRFTKVISFMRTDQIKVYPKCMANLTPVLQELCVCR